MKLAYKFVIALLLGRAALVPIEVYSELRLELPQIEHDLERDHRVLGKAIALSFTKLWNTSGQDAALLFIEETNVRKSHVDFHWIWLDTPPEGLDITEEQIASLARGDAVSRIDRNREPAGLIETFIPVPADVGRPGALEIRESLEDLRIQKHRVIQRSLLHALLIMGVYAALAVVLGGWLVGRPIGKLVQTARRVAAGDFSGRIALRQGDELADLGRELNSMCERLAEAQDAVATEAEKRIQAVEQLRRADRLAMAGKLASGIAHELGTPLNVIMARAKMISDGDLEPQEVTQSALIIHDESVQMTKNVRQILNFARPRNPSKTPVDLWKIIHQTVGLLSPMAQRRGVTLEVGAAAGPVVAEVDADQIQQVLSNLVLNAIHASASASRVRIELDRRRAAPSHGGPEAECACLSVRDEGTGISEENLAHIFEPFFTTKDPGEGTGLGLSISRGIVEEHGGWIAASSQLGKGSCFCVFLP